MPRGDAQPELIRAAALRLFATHSIAGTSLHMIAESLGVTKAALYHHFPAKSDIVRAVLAPTYDSIDELVRKATQASDVFTARTIAIEGLADHAVTHRELYGVMLHEAPFIGISLDDPHWSSAFERLREVLAAGSTDPETLVAVGIFFSGLVTASTNPVLTNLDDQTLRSAILAAGHRLLD